MIYGTYDMMRDRAVVNVGITESIVCQARQHDAPVSMEPPLLDARVPSSIVLRVSRLDSFAPAHAASRPTI